MPVILVNLTNDSHNPWETTAPTVTIVRTLNLTTADSLNLEGKNKNRVDLHCQIYYVV